MNRDLRRDLYAVVVAAALLVVTAALVGVAVKRAKDVLHVGWPPLYADWLPHAGPGTPATLSVAVAVVAYGPALAVRLPWRPLLWTAWATATAWTFSLALVDGWHRGIARRLTTRYEYLQVIDRFDDIPPHPAGLHPAHPARLPRPLAPARRGPPAGGPRSPFVLLDRIGLGGGAWAGVLVITVGAATTTAVLVTVRTLTSETLARRAAPFLALSPAAVWAGTSADGYFAAVAGRCGRHGENRRPTAPRFSRQGPFGQTSCTPEGTLVHIIGRTRPAASPRKWLIPFRIHPLVFDQSRAAVVRLLVTRGGRTQTTSRRLPCFGLFSLRRTFGSNFALVK